MNVIKLCFQHVKKQLDETIGVVYFSILVVVSVVLVILLMTLVLIGLK